MEENSKPVLFVKPENEEIAKYYENYRNRYNGDSGVDLYISEKISVPANSLGFSINHQIKCEMHDFIAKNTGHRYSYFLIPRSSISNTPLRMSNSIGLIDSGYRGDIIARVDNLSSTEYTIEKGSRLFQIVSPKAETTMLVKVVQTLSETDRGEKGFGSTNK